MINDLNQRIGVKHCQKILFQHFYTKMLKHVLKPTFLSLWKSKRNTISFLFIFWLCKAGFKPNYKLNHWIPGVNPVLLFLYLFAPFCFYLCNFLFREYDLRPGLWCKPKKHFSTNIWVLPTPIPSKNIQQCNVGPYLVWPIFESRVG